jgi:DNA-binding response OmpR family regulator
MKRILIIEDDITIAEIERDFLQISGFSVTIVDDGLQGLTEALSSQYDLILLDLMLPGMDGFEICKQIRDAIDIPILMVTAKTEDIDKTRGLGLGANDYITKPFFMPELIARITTNIAQYERVKANSTATSADKEIKIGSVRLNLKSRRVYVGDIEIECKTKEFDLLSFLMTNPEIVFSKETLYERIWGMEALGDIRTVAVHINRLRDKIEIDPANPIHIQTVWGAGYRFKAVSVK